MTKHIKTIAAIIPLACVALSGIEAAGPVDIVLDMNSLPSAQGWVFSGDPGAVETDVFSVSGGMLHQNSIGIGTSTTGTQGLAAYALLGVVDPALPFVLTTRVRVNQEEFTAANPTNAFGFGAGLRTTADIFQFGLGADRLEVDHGALRPIYLGDTTAQFHDYRLESAGGINFNLYVDGSLIDTGPAHVLATVNELLLGDFTRGPNVNADIASFEFHQVPEPSTCAILGLGLPAFLAARRRRSAQA